MTPNSTSNSLLDNFLFTRRFKFRTPVPVEMCAERISGLPFAEDNARFTTEIEPDHEDYVFDIWAGNRNQREPHKARVIGTGRISRLDNETLIVGEVRFGMNRMLILSIITVLMAFWVFGMFTTPLWFMYMFYTGGLPIIAPLYLFWQTRKERNRTINEIKAAVAPHLSDRRHRLQDDELASGTYAVVNDRQQRRRRQE